LKDAFAKIRKKSFSISSMEAVPDAIDNQAQSLPEVLKGFSE
jgi:hypothetical protein